jgi:multidrug resistance protein MdtO
VALGGVLLIIKWTYDYPLIRLVASVVLFFCAIYLMRVLGKLGWPFSWWRWRLSTRRPSRR